MRVTREAVEINTGVCPKGQIVSRIHAVHRNCFLLLSTLILTLRAITRRWFKKVSLPCSGQGVQV